MLSFGSFLFSLILLFTSTTQSYNATDRFFLDCGSSTTTDRRWDGDENAKFIPYNITNATSFSSQLNYLDPSVPQTPPYTSARIFNTSSSLTYTFPVSEGPKFLRLYFYPDTYSGLTPNQSFFSVSSNGYSLLSNFSAFLTTSFLENTRSNVKHFVKEYIIYVKDTNILNVTFTPLPNSYAFINGIEIVSMPEDLYFNSKKLKSVGMVNGPVITNDTALENIYRLNIGGRQISGTEDTGLYRSWDQDNNYIYTEPEKIFRFTPIYPAITYTTEFPDYITPELVYITERSMGNQSDKYNLTWLLPVDSGFFYNLRFHFCNIIPQYSKSGQVVFKIFINNQTADEEFDLFYFTQGSGYPFYKDYIVLVNDPDGSRGKQDMWVALHPNSNSELYLDAYLNGLEVFKLSMGDSLASPNPKLSSTTPPTEQPKTLKKNKKKPDNWRRKIIGGIGGALVLLSILLLIVFKQQRRVKHYCAAAADMSSYGHACIESKSSDSTLPSDRCRYFTLTEVKAATDEYHDKFVIGRGGFGTVYKGYIDNAKTVVAIKRLNSSSKQGFREFRTEIGFLSKLRHVQLVSLIGYCDEEGEMILVYDYMPNGTLQEHLYKNNNKSPLSWKRRLHICICAAKGLQYLHTGGSRAIIHRDVKSTNILLDENWVAKLSDFGLSKLGSKDQAKNHVSTMVKGTFGYIDPEYYRRSQLTDKSDVYSFGVVLLEVLCGRPPMNLRLPFEQVSLAELGRSCYRKGTLHEIIDPNLSGVIAPNCLMKFGEVAHSCLNEEGIVRPTMEDVVWGLEFALQLQEHAEKAGETVLENQQFSFAIQAEATTTDECVSLGSA